MRGGRNVHVLSDREVENLKALAAQITKKEHYHECLLRAGFYMPALKSSLCTVEYMQNVREGKLFCLKSDLVRYKACPRPPPFKVLLELLLQAAREERLNLGIEPNREPDQRWVLDMLSTLRPGLYIFDKGYVPALADREVPEAQQVDNSDGFWTG